MANESGQMSMDDILSDKPAVPVEKPATEKPAAEKSDAAPQAPRPDSSLRREHQKKEWEAQGRDPETGQFVKKEDKAVETEPAKPQAKAEDKPAAPAAPAATEKPAETKPQEEMTPKEKAAFAKAADETRKRQALEARLRELEARMQPQAPAAPAAPAQAAKTFWDDPEAALRATEEKVQQAVLGTRIQTSETIARGRYQDFDEKVNIFKDLALSTPGLAQQMLMAPDPAEFAYRTAANHKAIQDAGNVDALVAKAREEERARVRAEIEAELKAKAEALAKERAALPGSLTDAPSKGNHKTVWSGPTSFDDILGGR